MSKDKAREILEKQREKINEDLEKLQDLEKKIDEESNDADILGPRDDIERQRIRKDIEESEKDD